MKVTFELKVYTDATKTNGTLIREVKEYPQIDATTWTDEDIENFLDEEYEVWVCTRTDGGWGA